MKNSPLLFLLLALCSLSLASCSEYTAVLKSKDYEYRYEAAKALVSNPEEYDFMKILNW